MTKLGREIIEGLQEAVAYTNGEPNEVRVRVIHVPDVRAIREQLHMSQTEFANAYMIPLATLKGWEQGRRHPDQTAAAYLKVIARLPQKAREALHL